MRRSIVTALLLALPAFGCASIPGFHDLAPEPPPAITAAPQSADVDALLARFYGDGALDEKAITAALATQPASAGLHEMAGYAAILRADAHSAFGHFLAAAADKNAIAPELYLWEAQAAAHTATEHLRLQALLRSLAAEHPKPAIRQLATYELAREKRLFGEREEAEQLVAGLAFVDAWRVVGSFDNDQGKGFATEYPPETEPDRDLTFRGVRMPVKMRPLAARKLDGALPLGDALHPADAAVAYAETHVHADRARDVDLRLTTTSGVRVWLDGKQVTSDEKIFRESFDNVIVRLTLTAGEHRILVKIAHQTGPFRLAARLTDPATGAVLSLRATPTGKAGAGGSGTQVSPMASVERLTDENRKRFLLGRMWAREGHTQRPPHFFDPLRRDVPKNPLVSYFSALSLRDGGEVGKALDLFNDGVGRYPGATAFMIERARFYASRKLWDKAQRDLEAALAASPNARDAALELGAVHAGRGWTVDRCQALAAAVARWPDDVRAIDELAACREDQQLYEEAERLLRRARALAPGSRRTVDRLAELTARRLDFDAAEGFIAELQAADPTSLDFILDEAELFRRAGKRDRMEAALRRAQALSPDAPGPYQRLAYAAQEQGKKDEATQLFRQALTRDPDNASLAQRVGGGAAGSSAADRFVATAEDIDRALASADNVTVNPGSHVVVLIEDEIVTVNPDGSSKRVYTYVARAATTEGRDALIQARIPQSGKVTVGEAYAVKKDGERQEASSISGGMIRFRGLEVGTTIVLQYTHYAPPPRFLPNEYVEQWRFQRVNAQIESSRWVLALPKDRSLNLEVRGPVEQKTELAGDQKVWTFSVKGAPPIAPEPNMTPVGDTIWMATVGTVKDWDAFAKWENAILADAFTPSAELDALAKKLTAGAQSPREKLDRVWAYVAQEIRYQQEYEDSIAGVKPHAAAVVRERGYGDCKDKAVLLIQLARAVGVEARFALLRTSNAGKIAQGIPNQQFNHAIAYVPKQAGIDAGFFIDATTNGLDLGNARTDDEGALSLVIDPLTGRWEFVPIPYQPAEQEYLRHRFELKLADPKKATAVDRYESRGAIAAGMRIALRNKAGGNKFWQGITSKLFAGSTLISAKAEHDQDITRPTEAAVELDLAQSVQPDGGHFRLELPFLFPIENAAALAERKTSLIIWRGQQSVEIDAELGEGQVASHLPEDFKVEHACFTAERKTEVKGRKITVRSSYKNTCPQIAAADYPAFRAAVQKVVAKQRDRIVFGPRGKAGAKPKR